MAVREQPFHLSRCPNFRIQLTCQPLVPFLLAPYRTFSLIVAIVAGCLANVHAKRCFRQLRRVVSPPHSACRLVLKPQSHSPNPRKREDASFRRLGRVTSGSVVGELSVSENWSEACAGQSVGAFIATTIDRR